MTTGTSRVMWALIAVAALLAIGTLRHPEWFTGVGSRQQLASAMPLMAAPSDRSTITQRRISAKSAVIDQLVRDEISLFEAAQQFASQNSHPQGMEDVSWKHLPGRDDGEKLCRQVLIWVESELTNRGSESQKQMALQRLEQQLAQHLARHGGVRLHELES